VFPCPEVIHKPRFRYYQDCIEPSQNIQLLLLLHADISLGFDFALPSMLQTTTREKSRYAITTKSSISG